MDQFKRFIAETFGASVCNKIDDRSISEFVRYGGSEIIGVASIIGFAPFFDELRHRTSSF